MSYIHLRIVFERFVSQQQHLSKICFGCRMEIRAAYEGSLLHFHVVGQLAMQDLNAEDLQKEVYSLREREWPYYRKAQQVPLLRLLQTKRTHVCA